MALESLKKLSCWPALLIRVVREEKKLIWHPASVEGAKLLIASEMMVVETQGLLRASHSSLSTRAVCFVSFADKIFLEVEGSQLREDTSLQADERRARKTLEFEAGRAG